MSSSTFSKTVKAELELAGKSVTSHAKRNYVRTAFLKHGSITNPTKHYHLEFASNDDGVLDMLRAILGEYEVYVNEAQRSGTKLIYLKDSESISSALRIMGAHKSLIELENIRIEKELRNVTNRRTNCETSNIGKTVQSSIRQQEEIDYIEENGGILSLPAPLAEAALLRRMNQEATLAELAEIMGISKSGVNHRFRKISIEAAKLGFRSC